MSVSPNTEAVFRLCTLFCADVSIGAMLLLLTACHAEFFQSCCELRRDPPLPTSRSWLGCCGCIVN